MRDTIYFGYDPNAHISDHPLEDSIFRQKLQWVGTTKFYCWINDPDICHVDPSQCDSQFKVNVTPELGNTFPVGWNNVGFKNGMLPLKIS